MVWHQWTPCNISQFTVTAKNTLTYFPNAPCSLNMYYEYYCIIEKTQLLFKKLPHLLSHKYWFYWYYMLKVHLKQYEAYFIQVLTINPSHYLLIPPKSSWLESLGIWKGDPKPESWIGYGLITLWHGSCHLFRTCYFGSSWFLLLLLLLAPSAT